MIEIKVGGTRLPPNNSNAANGQRYGSWVEVRLSPLIWGVRTPGTAQRCFRRLARSIGLRAGVVPSERQPRTTLEAGKELESPDPGIPDRMSQPDT
jgi:hypothetical protein